jgi:cytochrome P450
VRGGTLPAGAAVAIFAPFFHRDGARLAYADAFAPDLWRDGYGPPTGDALVPFSAGPGECPGRNLVLLLAGAVLAEVLRAGDVRATDGTGVDAAAPLPATLSPFRLRFALDRPAGIIRP